MQPVLSVIIASFHARHTIARTLASLEEQRGSVRCEVIVVDSSSDDATASLVRRDFPWARLLVRPGRLFAGEARNVGASEASGDILALLDADCVVPSDWAEAVARAHTLPHPVIGGVVENGNPSSTTGWAYYFTEFNQWMPATPAGFVTEVPGCSMTLKRTAYDRYGPFMSGGYCSDTDFIWRLAADGTRPYLDPTIRVAHLNPARLVAVLRHDVEHGRHFARLRSREQLRGRSVLARAAAAPLLPPILFLRAARRAWQNQGYMGKFLRASPLTFATMMAWSLGEMRGYLNAVIAGANTGESPDLSRR